MADTDVLVVGAGPTGLVLALWLAKSGVRVRIVDRTSAPGTTSRAILLHARNLELYRQLGIADHAIAGGVTFDAANLWVRGRRVGHLRLGDIGAGISPYPYMLIFPQDVHEQMLVEELGRAGVQVERTTELVSFEETAAGVRARLRTTERGEEECGAAYLAGCDGAHSTVREALGITFPGGTYADLYYVADIDAEGPVANGEMHVALDDTEFLAIFPMKGEGRVRLVGQVRSEAHGGSAPQWEDVRGHIVDRLGIGVRRVRWFSSYRVHHRVAATFRRGRAFLLGDAAHIHSPVGGQGMNTGIGDAVNLAWKLAAVLQGRADPSVLDSYDAERIRFARTLVATTDRGFQVVSSRGPIARRVRTQLVPRLLPLLFRFARVRRLLFRTISQTAIRYRGSALSAGRAGRVAGGDRLPWVPLDGTTGGADNFASLASRDWQAHVYGDVAPALRALCDERGLALHVFAWRTAMGRAGLRRNAVYLVRPDGHVGLADETGSAPAVGRYLDTHGVRASGG